MLLHMTFQYNES